MAIDIVTGLYSLFLRDRMEEIGDYALHAADIQSEQLSDLLLEAQETEWGKRYDFKTIFSYQEFRERIPIQRLTDLKPFLKRMKSGEANLLWPGVPASLVSSLNDTTVPVSPQAIEETFIKGQNDGFALYLSQHPDSKLFEGFAANVGNGAAFPCMNELYALIRSKEPFLTSLINLPKRVGTDMDGNPSPQLVLQEALKQKVCSFKGTPERMNALLEAASRKKGTSSLKELWPDAEVLFQRYPTSSEVLKESRASLPEGLRFQASYCSPEGFFGIQDSEENDSFLLMLDLSNFYEFIPVGEADKSIVPLEDIETDRDYRMVVTNCSGLWRCCSEGPLFRFTSKAPYRFILV